MDISPDTILRNRYRIVRLLGQGGMGAVYLGYDLSLEHEVAVKINRSPTPQAANQFIAEARLLATLRHPNLPRVIDYFLEGQGQFLVMDYIAGEDLKTLSERSGALPLQQVLAWAEDLGSALSYLHHQVPPVFHRDIKPANLKLTHENEVVLVDFGIAKAAEAAAATATGAAGYTPGYAPPEQYGTGHTGAYSDQYAMGATLYHLLTGEKPVDAVQRLLGMATLSPAQVINPALPANVSQALERAMAVRPEDRFPTVDDFVRALFDPTYQITVPYQPASYAAAAPTVVASTHPAASAAIPSGPHAPAATAPPLAVPRRRLPWVGIGILITLAVLVVAAVAFGSGLIPAAAVPTGTSTPTLQPSASVARASPTPLLPTSTFPPSVTATLQATSTATAMPPTATPTAAPTRTFTLSPTPLPAMLGKGRSIAFSSDRGDGKTFQIWTMRVTLNTQGQAVASDFTQLTFDAGDKQQPAWSPDGTKILYVAPGSQAINGLDIYLLDLSTPGSKPVNLTSLANDDTEPAWSPDGSTIAFVNARSDKIRRIFFMNPDGTNKRQISTELEEFSPTWSPDGQWLAYIVLANNNNILYRRSKADNFAKGEFFDNKGMSLRTGQSAEPAWAPDGSRIVYVNLQLVGEGRIQTFDVATRGDKIVQLTSSDIDRQPAWSMDSQWVVFTSRRDGNPELYLLRSTGQDKPYNLTNSPSRDLWPAWQP